MKDHQNAIDAINHQHVLRIKINVMTVQFLTFSSVAEEAGCCRGVILAVGDAV